ncbi:MAG TPA: MazG family protein [Solirubrobacteraceae bacterium]|nr:MazG family protein [Solirubrobacteraceae bacterium]
MAEASSQALADLDQLTRRLRRECPWDREQDERSIVPHTVEEAYELADAAESGDDAKLLDELGDVLFQVVFLSLLLEERGVGDLGQVAEHCRQKLIRRHPHVFADAEVADAADVLRNWDAIKGTEPGREPGVFGEVPENLPALLYARKLQRRAASAGLHRSASEQGTQSADRECFRDIGERLFALVDEARVAKVDPELALRAAARRFAEQIENGER